jgi:hypothetical protein
VYDSIIATLPCGGEPHVGEIQTRIRGSAADDSTLSIGYQFDPGKLTRENLERNGYVRVNDVPPGAPIRLLDVWSRIGGPGERWALWEIADGELRSVVPVVVDRATLDSAHYISALNAAWLAQSLGHDSAEPAVDVLRRRLPG